jgi:hypothetical protein
MPDATVVDARVFEDVSALDAVTPASVDVAVSRRAPRQRAIVVRPEREYVPLYGVSPKAWNKE